VAPVELIGEAGQGFTRGFGDGVKDSVTGLVGMVTHPVQAGKTVIAPGRDRCCRVS